jgi:hypothetical protein
MGWGSSARRGSACWRSHSHAGGGDKGGSWPSPAAGSPPRGWGGVFRRGLTGHRHRATPTLVGQRPSRGLAQGGSRDHPHAGGAGLLRLLIHWSTAEPLPRTRGGGRAARTAAVPARDTPTCVGGGLPRRQTNRGRRVTPTLVGGRANWTRPEFVERRATPTRVGRRIPVVGATWRRASHAHEDGAERGNVRVVITTNESPPRGWGGVEPVASARAGMRGTPTRVGRNA